MALPTLLAKAGNFRGYATKLGEHFHIDTKELVRKLISLGYKKFSPIVAYKEKNGWIKDHVKADLESFDFVAKIMLHPMNHEHMAGWKDKNDPNYIMLKQIMEIKAVVQDEDSFYDMIELVRLKWVHEHWDLYEQSAEKAYQIINFPNFYKDLIEHSKPLPQLPKKEAPEEMEINYVEAEEELMRDGMERKG